MLRLLLYFPGPLKLLEGRNCTLFFSVHPKVTSTVSYRFLPQVAVQRKRTRKRKMKGEEREEEAGKGKKRRPRVGHVPAHIHNWVRSRKGQLMSIH